MPMPCIYHAYTMRIPSQVDHEGVHMPLLSRLRQEAAEIAFRKAHLTLTLTLTPTFTLPLTAHRSPLTSHPHPNPNPNPYPYPYP